MFPKEFWVGNVYEDLPADLGDLTDIWIPSKSDEFMISGSTGETSGVTGSEYALQSAEIMCRGDIDCTIESAIKYFASDVQFYCYNNVDHECNMDCGPLQSCVDVAMFCYDTSGHNGNISDSYCITEFTDSDANSVDITYIDLISTPNPTPGPTRNTMDPTTTPTLVPTTMTTSNPTVKLTVNPSEFPTTKPTADPITRLTEEPTTYPSTTPTMEPTMTPSDSTVDDRSIYIISIDLEANISWDHTTVTTLFLNAFTRFNLTTDDINVVNTGNEIEALIVIDSDEALSVDVVQQMVEIEIDESHQDVEYEVGVIWSGDADMNDGDEISVDEEGNGWMYVVVVSGGVVVLCLGICMFMVYRVHRKDRIHQQRRAKVLLTSTPMKIQSLSQCQNDTAVIPGAQTDHQQENEGSEITTKIVPGEMASDFDEVGNESPKEWTQDNAHSGHDSFVIDGDDESEFVVGDTANPETIGNTVR